MGEYQLLIPQDCQDPHKLPGAVLVKLDKWGETLQSHTKIESVYPSIVKEK